MQYQDITWPEQNLVGLEFFDASGNFVTETVAKFGGLENIALLAFEIFLCCLIKMGFYEFVQLRRVFNLPSKIFSLL